MEEIKPRTVGNGDYVKGRLVYPNEKGEKKETTFDFYIVKKEEKDKLIRLIKLHNLGENIIVDEDMPIGKEIYGKLTNTTFIIDNSRFYIDEIYTFDEMVTKKGKSKN